VPAFCIVEIQHIYSYIPHIPYNIFGEKIINYVMYNVKNDVK
jgi:hypothetical protein